VPRAARFYCLPSKIFTSDKEPPARLKAASGDLRGFPSASQSLAALGIDDRSHKQYRAGATLGDRKNEGVIDGHTEWRSGN
jgi:hypothetical protein